MTRITHILTHKVAAPAVLPVVLIGLAACQSTPDPKPEPVFVPPPEVRTCLPREELVAEIVPAETRQYTAVTLVDNPPYAPIERRETVTREVKPAFTRYRDASGEVVDAATICDDDLVTQPVL